MIEVQELTTDQVHGSYLLAVKASLMRFYAKTEAEAESLVQEWLDRNLSLAGSEPGLFLHDEAMTLAADLARAPEVPVTAEDQAIYAAICVESELQANLARHSMRLN